MADKENIELRANIEAEVGSIIDSAEIRNDVLEWLDENNGNISKCLIIWINKDSGIINVFGSNMKCVEAVGYLETAKTEMIDYMYKDDDENDKPEDNIG